MSEFEYPKAILLNGNSRDDSDGPIDYGGLFHRYILSKWYIYLAFGALFIGMAYYSYKKMQPVYEITSKLMIREREQSYGPADDIVKNNVNFSAASESATNEIEILSSFALMHSAVEDLGLEKRYFWKHKLSEYDAYPNFPIAVDTFALSTATASFEITPLSNSTFRFSAGSETETHKFGDLFSNQYGTFRISRTGVVSTSSDSTMHVEFLNSQRIARNYQNEFSVESSDEKNKSSVLILTLRDVVPQRGMDVLARLLKKFDQTKTRTNEEIALKTLSVIQDRLANIGSELSSAESTVESYKLDNDIFAETTSDLNYTLEEVNNVVREQRSLELQMKMLKAMKSDLQDSTDKFKLIPINPALYDGRIQDLVQPYNDVVAERERLLMKGGQSSNPVIQEKNQKLKSFKNSINAAIDHMQDDLELQASKLQNQFNVTTSRLRSVPIKERGLSDKLRNQSITENLYIYLLQKREETSLALVSNYTNAMVVDPPYSTLEPVAPSKVKIFMGAALGGMAVPLFLILLLDLFKSSIRTEQEIRQILPEKTILGVINHQDRKNQQLLLGHPQNLTTERFRSLRTNLQFHYREKTKCILVTSSTSGEGKTFIATNLATSFALAKKKTIVIDFDLRKPSVIKYFNGNPEIGLSSFLIEELGIEEIIQVSSELPNLHYISGGPLIVNLLELITEQQLTELFTHLKAKYEVIIIDSSPIGIIADGILLNNYVDNSLFVVRSSYTKKAMVEKAKEIFAQNKLVNPSIIFNGVKKQNDSYGYSYKNYGYA